jgi:hypothetical protein
MNPGLPGTGTVVKIVKTKLKKQKKNKILTANRDHFYSGVAPSGTVQRVFMYVQVVLVVLVSFMNIRFSLV